MPDRDKPGFVRRVHGTLKDGGRYMLMAFSERNGFSKSLSGKRIRRLFSGHFRLGPIGEEVHTEPGSGKVWLYVALMRKNKHVVKHKNKQSKQEGG